MEGEQERLERMYDELGDEHLRDLAADHDSLTDVARIALQHVLTRRGLAAKPRVDAEPHEQGPELEEGFTPGIPGVFPSSAGAMEKALEPGGAQERGMVNLMTFFDGHELSKACAALEEEDIDLVLEPQDRDAMSGAPPSFALWVPVADHEAAEQVLRAKLGLFPLPEVGEGDDEEDDDAGPDADGLVVLGEFETPEEAEQARLLLESAGINASLHVEDLDEADGQIWYVVKVKPEEKERGLAAVAAGMGL